MQSPRGGAKWNAPDGMSLAEIEKHAVESVLDRTGGNIKLASEILGVDRSTLYAMVRRHNIPR
jgi:transcriptional regulator of acetoin/glycerol metabolism